MVREVQHESIDDKPSGLLVEEVRLWHTPLIGAYLLWRFTDGYCKAHPEGDAPIALLHFIAAAILTNAKLHEPISRRRKNLQSYALGFENDKNVDLLLTIQERATERKAYTLAAIDAAICQGLLVWDFDSAKLYPCHISKNPRRGKGLRPSIVKEGSKAEILGAWFAEHDVATIGAYLKVVF